MADPVFINCPFDSKYAKKFRATLFTIIYCGFEPKCALEFSDNSLDRLNKITRIIGACRLSIHDISRTQLDPVSKLPRFNMPFELGIMIGAKRFGGTKHARKACLVLDTEDHRHQRFLSDIAGLDVRPHNDRIDDLIIEVGSFLKDQKSSAPGYQPIIADFGRFVREFPAICGRVGIRKTNVRYNDFVNIASGWIAKRATT